jgi:hypothetical protein
VKICCIRKQDQLVKSPITEKRIAQQKPEISFAKIASNMQQLEKETREGEGSKHSPHVVTTERQAHGEWFAGSFIPISGRIGRMECAEQFEAEITEKGSEMKREKVRWSISLFLLRCATHLHLTTQHYSLSSFIKLPCFK